MPEPDDKMGAGTASAPGTMLVDHVDLMDVPTSSRLPTPDRQCRATSKRTGNPCQRWTVPGAPVCSYHGANAAVRAKAAQTLATREVTAIVARRGAEVTPLDDPVSALLETAARVRAVSDLLGDRLANASEEDSIGLVGAYRSALKDTGVLLSAVVRAGLTERKVQVVEAQQAQLVAGWLTEALNSPDADLAYEQVAAIRSSFADAIRVHQAG
jgi:hypothetical protein